MPRLPARVADWAVALRTWALRLASPLEARFRPAAAAPAPPLWLRRHAGPLRAFRSSAEGAVDLLERLELLRPGVRVLDFGCGPGSLVPLLRDRVGPEGRYLGLDVHGPSIAWCAEAYAEDPRFAFRTLAGGTWPAATAAWDLVVAKSVFTHLLEPEARGAMAEIRRCLAPGGRALVTAFCFDGERFAAAELPWFGHSGPDGALRWRRAVRPTAAIAYDRSRFEGLCEKSELAVERFVTGYFPGGAAPPTGQDSFVLALR